MNPGDEEGARKAAKRDHGPQGTQVFGRGEVDRLIEEASATRSNVRRAQLKGLSVEVQGREFPLKNDRLVIGRGPACDLVLSDASVSAEHARINHDSGGWRVVNLLSTNGTFVNGQKVSNAELRNGDRVRFGRVEFLFQDPDAPGSAGPTAGNEAGWLRWLPWVVGAAMVVGIVWFVLR